MAVYGLDTKPLNETGTVEWLSPPRTQRTMTDAEAERIQKAADEAMDESRRFLEHSKAVAAKAQVTLKRSEEMIRQLERLIPLNGRQKGNEPQRRSNKI